MVGIPAAMATPFLLLQDMPVAERVTVLGILLFVLISAVALVKSQGSQLVQAVKSNTKAQTESTATLMELVMELKDLAKINHHWKNQLLDAIARVEVRMEALGKGGK